MKKFYTYVTRPYVISILPAIIIIILVPLNVNRYALKVDSYTRHKDHAYIWYDDLDMDGLSERILAPETDKNASLNIFKESVHLNQWNFKGTFNFANCVNIFITGDYRGIGKKEIFIFSIYHDSIFLSGISNLHDSKPAFKNRFIATTGWGINGPDPYIIPAKMEDLNGDGTRELIFGIGSGFSKYPRRVYAYYIDEDSLVKSPESYYSITTIHQADLTGDGVSEIILGGYNAENVNPDTTRYHDSSNWLMVLDHNLEFLFEPVELFTEKGGIGSFSLYNGDREELYIMTTSDNHNSVIKKFNPDGTLIQTWLLDLYAFGAFLTSGKRNQPLIGLKTYDKGFVLLDTALNISYKVPFKNPNNSFHADLTGDGKEEIIVTDYQGNRIYVYQTGMRHPTMLNILLDSPNYNKFSIKKRPDKPDLISFQSGQQHYLIEYRKNPYYLLNYGGYLLIYIGTLGFVLLIRKIQKTQIEKKLRTEKKINELQISIVQNQLNSHFSLNMMNSVMYSIMINEADEACENLRRFANLYKSLLFSAGSVLRKLSDEIDFCTNYLLLEKSRFTGKLDFEIIIEPHVDMDFPVPVMAIHLYAENAIKHGISPMESPGMLKIYIDQSENSLAVTVMDNGVGRGNSSKNHNGSTGKGLEIMSEFYRHLKTFYNFEISEEITDLYHGHGQPAGTRVKLSITRDYAKQRSEN